MSSEAGQPAVQAAGRSAGSTTSTAAASLSGPGIGIDIGGTGIKGACVDLATGEFTTERLREPTPTPSTPEAVTEVVARIVTQLEAQLPQAHDAPGDGGAVPIGVTFPAVIQAGIARTAANVDPSWIGTDVVSLLAKATGHPVFVVNDADAAGVAEARFGAAKDKRGVVFMATLGTGIGTALLVDGILVPNTELGHLQLDGHDAEKRASDSARERHELSWKQWAGRLSEYFGAIEALLWPDLIVVGGGVSKKSDKFLDLIEIRTPMVPAQLLNAAGIVGAAVLAAEHHS